MSDTVIPKILRIPLLAALSLFALGSPLSAAAAPNRADDVELVDDASPSSVEAHKEPTKSKDGAAKATKPKKADGKKADKKKPSVKKGDKKAEAKAGKKGDKAKSHADKKKVAAKDKSKPKSKDAAKDGRVAQKGVKDAKKDKSKDKAHAKQGDERVASRDKKDDGSRALAGTRPSRAAHPPKAGAKKGAVEPKPGERSRKKVSRRDAQEKRNAAAAEKSESGDD